MKKAFLVLILILIAFNLSFAKLRVVTTTQDLASIARFIGKDRIELDYIAKGYQDPHFVDPKPSYLLKLRDADLLIAVGLELEVGWLPTLIKDSRNTRMRFVLGPVYPLGLQALVVGKLLRDLHYGQQAAGLVCQGDLGAVIDRARPVLRDC